MASYGATFSFRHRFMTSFLNNLGTNKSQNLPKTWVFNRAFSQNMKNDQLPPSATIQNRFLKMTGLHTSNHVQNVQGNCSALGWSKKGICLPWISGCGRTFSTLSVSGLSASPGANSCGKNVYNMSSNRTFLGSTNFMNSAGQSSSSGAGHISLGKPAEVSPMNNPAWHGVRLSNENGYLSYNRNSYLCLVIGATMNVQDIIPHSAEAAVAFFILGALNVIFGTVGFIMNLKQLQPNLGLSRLAMTTQISWALVHIVFYFLIAFLYLQTLEEGETLEDVGRSIQSRGGVQNILDLDDDDNDN